MVDEKYVAALKFRKLLDAEQFNDEEIEDILEGGKSIFKGCIYLFSIKEDDFKKQKMAIYAIKHALGMAEYANKKCEEKHKKPDENNIN